jgi:hypothetical protein
VSGQAFLEGIPLERLAHVKRRLMAFGLGIASPAFAGSLVGYDRFTVTALNPAGARRDRGLYKGYRTRPGDQLACVFFSKGRGAREGAQPGGRLTFPRPSGWMAGRALPQCSGE